jgi:hypothetical protein
MDYARTAGEWMKPLRHGKEIDLVEIGPTGMSTTCRA